MSSPTPPTTSVYNIAILGAGPAGLCLARILALTATQTSPLSLSPSSSLSSRAPHPDAAAAPTIKITLYDRDPSPIATSSPHRPQGGSLDLHAHTAQAALRRSGLWARVEPLLRYDAQDVVVADGAGRVVMRMGGEDRDKPEIGQGQLRGLLVDGVEELELEGKGERGRGVFVGVEVRWGWKVVGVERAEGEEVEKEEEEEEDIGKKWVVSMIASATPPPSNTSAVDGDEVEKKHDGEVRRTEGPFDLVVGADGTWSRARSALTPIKPLYSNLNALELTVPATVGTTHPHLSNLIGRGSYLYLSSHKGLMCQRNHDASIRIYLVLPVPELFTTQHKPFFATHPKQAKEWVLTTYFADWSPDAQALVRLSTDEIRFWPLYDLPETQVRWLHRRGLTLVGDAAHTMSPWLGEGVNLALEDAATVGVGVGTALRGLLGLETGGDGVITQAEVRAQVDGCLRAYEEEMWARTEGKIVECRAAGALLFSDDSPNGFAEMVGRAREAAAAAAAAGSASDP